MNLQLEFLHISGVISVLCSPSQGNVLGRRKPRPQMQSLPQLHNPSYSPCGCDGNEDKVLCSHPNPALRLIFPALIAYIPCCFSVLMLSQLIAKAFCFPSSGLGPFHLGIPSVFPSVLRLPPPPLTRVPPQLGLTPPVPAFRGSLTPKCPVSSGLRWLAPFCSWLSAQLGVHATISEPRLLFLSPVPAHTAPASSSAFF